MHRLAVLAAWMCLVFGATALAGTVKTQEVTLASGSDTIAGYLAVPESPGRHPALIVLHEDWGLTDWVKVQAKRFAEQGFLSLAVDLYRGQTTFDPYVAYDLMVSTPRERALQDMEATFNFLAARPDVNKEKIGSIGWSMGGKWSLVLAASEPRLAACVVNYGSLLTDPADIQKIHAPVLGIFGADDHTITASDLDAFVAAMDTAHKSFDLKVYPRAGHGFENSESKLGFRESAADDAWERTIAFLREHLT